MDHYDWVVIGDHPGALLSASLVSRLGLSVLILPVEGAQVPAVGEAGQIFDPESNFVLGLRNLIRSDGLLAHCLGKIGLQPSEEQMILKEGALPQVITPESRVSLFLNESDLNLEWMREFGKDTVKDLGFLEALKEAEPTYLKYWAELPDRLTWVEGPQNKKSKKTTAGSPTPASQGTLDSISQGLIKKSKLSPLLRKRWHGGSASLDAVSRDVGRKDLKNTFLGLLFGTLNSPTEDIGATAALHLLTLGRSGASFRGGMAAYREFLLRLAKRAGAHVPEKMVCKRLFIENGRIVGVQASGHGNMIGVGAGILGCLLKEARELLAEGGPKAVKKIKKDPTPIGWKFTVVLTVHTEAIPPGMGSRVVWQEKGAPALEIEMADPLTYGIREPENKLIFIRTVLPYTDQSLDVAYQRLIATRMLRQLMEIMPFLEFHVTSIFPDFRSVEASRMSGTVSVEPAKDPLLKVYGFSKLEEIPARLLCYAGEGVGIRSGVDSLFVANSESFPLWGSFGPTVAAIESVAWLAHRSGLRGPLV